jgi:hypothetical protein
MTATAIAVTDAPTPAPSAGMVGSRVARLRTLARTAPGAARDDAWAWFVEAGHRRSHDRDGALAELAELFAAGEPSHGVDGQTQGLLVTFTIHPAVDRAMAAITALWMPWLGKRFDAATRRGINLLAGSARWPSKLLWPAYAMRDAAAGLLAFDFTTRIERGAVEPRCDVLVIDYASVPSNPALLIRSVRDELVEIVPGAHLGRMLWAHGDGRHSLLAYFALRTPV